MNLNETANKWLKRIAKKVNCSNLCRQHKLEQFTNA